MSKSIAIVTDSNSGITQSQASELGIFVIPMPFTIDGNDYFEDINLNQEQFYQMLLGDCTISTSQPSPDTVMTLWDELLKGHDEVIYIPMSSGLSGSYQTARMLAEDYEGKVEVVNNQRISVTMRQSVLDAIKLKNQGLCAKDIRRKLEDDRFNSSIYICIDTLEYLKKGGRLTPAVAMLGQLLKIKPVLQIQGEKLDAFAKVRTMSAAKSIMINAVKSDIAGRISENGKYKYVINIAHTNNLEAAQEFEKEIRLAIPEYKGEIRIMELSLSVTCHIGPGALALAVSRVVE